MNIIGEVYENNNFNNYFDIQYKIRKAARVIILNESNQIALMYVGNGDYHKLPGGGLEAGEEVKVALEREVIEEVGANSKVIDDIGVVIEYRNKINQLQISYCFLTKVVGNLQEPSFTEDEIENGFKLKWVDIHKACELISNDNPTDYIGEMINKRDYIFLSKARKIVDNMKI